MFVGMYAGVCNEKYVKATAPREGIHTIRAESLQDLLHNLGKQRHADYLTFRPRPPFRPLAFPPLPLLSPLVAAATAANNTSSSPSPPPPPSCRLCPSRADDVSPV